MNRSPLFYPLNRGADAEVGGAADLQTDVMRFMALLSLCLVAIFALVQSIPLSPSPQADKGNNAGNQSASMPTVVATDPAPVARPITAIPVLAEAKLIRPTSQLSSPPAAVQLQRPAPVKPLPNDESVTEPGPSTTIPGGSAANSPASVHGFSLRFETDQALTRLVETQVVGLYVIADNNALRLNVTSGDLSFWPASIPAEFHEMDESTVPKPIIAAYPDAKTRRIRWGVTLPAQMSAELNDFLTNADGGRLTITGNGRIELL